jgi:dolichyl-diphosphooligosaccharide--protein glycosyltransferase
MVENGLFSPYTDHWINYQQWYPDGLDMSGSLPALPMTAAVLYQAVSFLGVNVDLMTFCSLLAVVLGTLSCLILYFVGKDLGGRAVGLFAALLLALAPSFIQRSSLGFFDTELPGIIGLLLFTFMFLRAIDQKRSLRGTLIYSIGAALSLAYFICGWGAAYYILGLSALFIFAIVILKRYDRRILMSYGISMGIGLLIAIQFPSIGYSYLTSAPVLLVATAFIALLIAEFMRHNISTKNKLYIAVAAFAAVLVSLIPMVYFGYIGDIKSKFIAVISPIARASTPLIASVAEHRVTAWANIYTELGICILFFLVGIYFTLKNPTNRNIFLIIFGVTGLYFGASMVRLLVIFAPAFALIMGMGLIKLLKPFTTLLKETPNTAMKAKRKLFRVNKEFSILGILMIFIILMTQFAFTPRINGNELVYTPRAYANGYMPTSISAAGLPVVPYEPLTQWIDMLQYTNNNLRPSNVVVAWWDYGYWLSVVGNVTTLADNATIDEQQIENIAFVYMGTEEQALKMLSTYGQQNVQYILVFTTLYIVPSEDSETGYVSFPGNYGDEGKWAWMARISGGAKDRLISEGFMYPDQAWTDEHAFGAFDETYNQWMWSVQGAETVIYKLLTDVEHQYAAAHPLVTATSVVNTELQYLTAVYISGLDTNFNQQGDLIPLVGLYKIDWAAYNKDHPVR